MTLSLASVLKAFKCYQPFPDAWKLPDRCRSSQSMGFGSAAAPADFLVILIKSASCVPVCLNLLKCSILVFGLHCKSRTEIHFISFHIHSYPFTFFHSRFHTLDFISHQFTLNFISFHTHFIIHFISFHNAFTIQFTLHFISFHILFHIFSHSIS